APESIRVRHGDTQGTPQGVGTFGSRSTVLGGSAVFRAATEVREKGGRLAASLLEAAPADVVPVVGGWEVRGVPGRRATWAQVADLAYRGTGLPKGEAPGLDAHRVLQRRERGVVVRHVRRDRRDRSRHRPR